MWRLLGLLATESWRQIRQVLLDVGEKKNEEGKSSRRPFLVLPLPGWPQANHRPSLGLPGLSCVKTTIPLNAGALWTKLDAFICQS